jgi:hypothetical protein
MARSAKALPFQKGVFRDVDFVAGLDMPLSAYGSL